MMQHRHAEESLWGAVEIIPNRLYYAPLKFFPNQDDDHNDVDSEEESRNNNTSNNINTSSTSNTTQTTTSTSTTSNSNSNSNNNNNKKTNTKKEIHYFSIDNDLIYWNFFLDFGPLNLGQLYRFCSTLNAKLSDPKLSNSIICFYSGGNSGQYRANASVLMCAWEMLYLGRTLEESYWGWRNEQEELEEVQEVQEVSRQFGGKGGGPPSSNVSMPPELRSVVMRQSHKAAAATAAAAATSNTPSSSSSSSNTPSNNDGINSINNNSNTTTSPFAKLHPLPPFHDASPILCTYDLSVYDCLSGLDKARRHGFFKFGNAHPVVFHKAPMIVHNDNNNNNIINNNNDDVNDNHDNGTNSNNTSTSISHTGPNTFNIQEYEYFEQVEKGDLNWIIQNKIIAFAGPHAQKVITPEGFCMLTPRDYIPYFLKSNVKLVIRLNKKCYDEREFTKVGIKHVDHYYLDGSCPEMSILLAVVKDMESIAPDEAFAIHCKAGLGRTGTCIGAYMMKHFRMTAREVIGWMRICRPGMVIGPQQHFLQDIESVMWQEGEVYRSNVKGNNRWVLPWVMVDNDEGKMQEQEKEKEKDGAVVAAAAAAAATPAPSSIMATPGKHTSGHGVSIVTPDHHHSLVHHAHVRQEVKTPAARKLDTQYDVSMTANTSATAAIPASPTASASMSAALSSNSSPLPTIDTLNVQEMEREQHHHQQQHQQQQQQQQQQPQEACPMNVEESQAHGLLSRRLDQFQVRHGQQQQQQQQNASQQNSR